jgi:phytoene dehydrogenase-like protein
MLGLEGRSYIYLTDNTTTPDMKKNVIIVGGGIAGLSAGCYAQMNGFNSSVYEMHNIPGGLCTGWERKGYRFDLSMHFLTGSASGPFFTMWKELGIIENTDFHYHKQVMQIEGMGRKLVFFADKEKLERDMLAISPEDADLIKEFTTLLFGPDMMKAANLKPKELRNFRDSLRTMLAVLPLFRVFRKYGRMTLQEFAAKFRDPFLQKAIRSYVDAPGWPMADFPMAIIAGFMKVGVTEGGVPLGGSQKVVFGMADRYKQMGGKLYLKSRVKNLVIENHTVMGIVMEDGTRHPADEVIWAGDGHTLIYQMLKGEYVNGTITKMYDQWKPKESVMHVMMGVNRDFSDESHMTLIEAEEPVAIAGRRYPWLQVRHRCFDPSMAPEGKSAVEVWYDTDFDYWEALSGDKKSYKAEKNRIARETIEQLDKHWPGFASQVEMFDVSTPHTYYRYTGNYKGSPDGWCINMDNMRDQEPVRTLPGLKGLRMIGQWTAPYTGVVIAAQTARQAIQLLCKEEHKKFVTKDPGLKSL